MKMPKFTFKLPEPQIPPEVPEEFKEYIKRENLVLLSPLYYDYFANTMPFEKFKEILGKNRKCSDIAPDNIFDYEKR